MMRSLTLQEGQTCTGVSNRADAFVGARSVGVQFSFKAPDVRVSFVPKLRDKQRLDPVLLRRTGCDGSAGP